MASSRFPFGRAWLARIRAGNYDLFSLMCKRGRKFYT
jgi:hypothetical protein